MVKKELINCIVPGCDNNNEICPEKTFFPIPFTDERCQHWLLVCRREDLLANTELSNNVDLTVCSDHFIEDHFENKNHSKLKNTAVPTIFPCFTINFANKSDCNIVMEDPEETNNHFNTEINLHNKTYDDLEHVGNIQQLCRLCANVTSERVYLFSSTGQKLHLAKKINSSLPVTVKNTDLLPKQLCTECVMKVNICYQFAEMCLIAEEKLLTLVEKNYFHSHPVPNVEKIIPQNNEKEIELDQHFSSITVVDGGYSEIKQNCSFEVDGNEDIMDTSEDDITDICSSVSKIEQNPKCILYSCPLCCEGNLSVKSTDESHKVAVIETSYDSSSATTLNVCVSDKESSWSDGNTTESADINSSRFQDTAESVVSETNQNTNRSDIDEENDWWNEENASTSDTNICINNAKNKESTVTDDQTINHKSICCYVCQESFSNVSLCLIHSKEHFCDGHYPCNVCGKVFSDEVDLTHHSRYHLIVSKKFNAKGKRLKCDYCEKRFNSPRTFFNHSCSATDTKQFHCSVCRKSYTTQERLLFHQKFHEGAKANYCDQCGKKFDNEGTLYYHTRMVHEGERPFACNICSKKFYSNSRLMAHKRVHTGERPFECEVCGRRFYDRDTLKGHYVTHMSVKPFQCDLCGLCWGRKSMLNQHMRTRHSDDTNSRRAPSLIHYYCKICDRTFTNSTDVMVHRTSHGKMNTADTTLSNVHICENCGESFNLASALIRHRKQKHPNDRPYICSICKEASHTLYEARLHRNTHAAKQGEKKNEDCKTEDCKSEDCKASNPSKFICEACGNIFTEKRRFMRHMREHGANPSHQCQTCGKRFIDNRRLTIHLRSHTGEKPYSCEVCAKRFSQRSALYTHALLHTGEKPHSCDLCGKAFRIKADRDNHRRTHTGEKPYKCEFCEKSFRTGQVYYQHRMIHTGERRFPCNICGKAFKRSHTLVVHKRIHTGEKPNICDICGKGFRQRSDMRKHRSLHGSSSQQT